MRATVLGIVIGLALVADASGAVAQKAVAASNGEGQALLRALADADETHALSLIRKNVDVNVRDENGATPLLWATMRANADIVARLLGAGADPNIYTANHVSPLQTAVAGGEQAIVALLLAAGADANAAGPTGETPLMTAARTGQIEVMKQLIARNADVNARENKYAQTALMWSAGEPAQVKLLIDHGADVHARTKSWNAATIKFTQIVITLGRTGIPTNSDGEYVSKKGGQSALFFAVLKNDIESIKYLLGAGTDVNDEAADGSTALHLALLKWDAPAFSRKYAIGGGGPPPAFAPNLTIANLLLDRGAKVNVVDDTGYTPLHGAVLAWAPQAASRALDGSMIPPSGPSIDGQEALAVVKRLLKMGANPNAATRHSISGTVGAVRMDPAPTGSSPLHVAATILNPELTTLLLENGADPNLIREDGHSPLSVAVMKNNLAGVTAMAARGGDVKRIYNPDDMIADPVESIARARKNQTLLHIAGAAGADQVIKFLVDRGVSLKRKNDKGETALDLADAQERFRHGLAREGLNGEFNANAVRETKTTDALKQAMGVKAVGSVRSAKAD